MKKSLALLLSLTVVMALSAPALGGARTPAPNRGTGGGTAVRGPNSSKGTRRVPGEFLVKFKGAAGEGGAHRGEADALRRRVGAVSSEQLGSTGIELVKVTPGDLDKAIAQARASSLVEYAVPNYIRRADGMRAAVRRADSPFSPDDPVYAAGDQWNMSQPFAGGGINMENAWDDVFKATGHYGGSPSVIVAILDTGVAYRTGGGFVQADDLAGTHFVAGYDFVNMDSFPSDDNGHGTHVCGTIAQTTNNTIKCAGIAFDCSIMPVKVLDRQGSGSDSEIIQGITFATDHGAEVINMSFSGPDPNPALEDACDYAFSHGVVVCASTGNASTNFVDYPAAYPSCVAVGATTSNKARADYSNYGSALDVMAPGGDNSKPIWQETFVTEGEPLSGFGVIGYYGTSMASPHAAATCALVKAVHPTWTASQVRGAVSLSCHDLGSSGWDAQFGWGLIDAHAAVNEPRPSASGPSMSKVSPDFGTASTTVGVTASGTNFSNPCKLTLARTGEVGLDGTSVSQGGSTQITCHLDLAGVQPGLWDVTVENKALLSSTIQGGYMVDAANDHTWYLAEGSTNYGFEEFILIQNLASAVANANVLLMTADGPHGPYPMQVPPQSRVTLRVNDVLPDADVSAKITADQDIVCERSMYWGNRVEGTDSIGVQAPSFSWYLAEGSTDYGFDTFLLIQNPNARAANVSVTYLTPSGTVEKMPFTIDGNSRYTINVQDDLPGENMSFVVEADQRVIAERSMYWDGRRGGHDSIGTNGPAQQWYLAEGSTDWGFDEWLLLENPGSQAANVQLTYMTPSGPVPQAPLSVPAKSRVTVHVNTALPSKDVSVEATADRGIVVERSMYWNNGTGKAGSCEIGVPQARQQCFLAEGSTDWGFDEWLLIQNPNSSACNVGVYYMTTSGLVPTTGFSIPANSRVTVHVNSQVPGRDTSSWVFSNLRIVAERSMYWHNRGGGHVSTGLMK